MDEKEGEGSFGVERLDNIAMGKVLPGMMGLFYGPTGTGKSSILAHYLFQGAREGSNVCLITDEVPSRAAARMSSFEGYNQKWLKDGYISILNLKDMASLIGVRLGDMTREDCDLMYDLLVQTIGHLDARRVVIDPVNLLVDILDKFNDRTFFSGLKGEVSTRGAAVIYAMDISKGPESLETGSLNLHDLDIIIRFRKEKVTPMVLDTLTIERWRGTLHSKSTYVVDISGEGVMLVPRIKPMEVV